MPTSELVFHSGKAIASPTSRMAKTVSVLATAHSMPAMIAVGIRWRFCARSANTLARAFHQRGQRPARGEHAGHHAQRNRERREAGVDQLGGRFGRAQPHARAQPAQHAQPVHRSELFLGCRPLRSLRSVFFGRCVRSAALLMQRDQQGKADAEHDERNQEVTVGENSAEFLEFSHRGMVAVSNWRNHKDASRGLSTGRDGKWHPRCSKRDLAGPGLRVCCAEATRGMPCRSGVNSMF